MSKSEFHTILAGARRGRPDDVAALVERLPSLRVLLPLALPRSEGSLDVDVHLVPGPLGEKLGPIFTDERILSGVGQRFGWTTAGADLQLLEVGGRDALVMMLEIAHGGGIFGGALNPYDPTALELRAAEIQGILAGDAKPLQRRLSHFPARDDHPFFTGAAHEPSPKELDRALALFVDAHQEISRYGCAEAGVEDRVKPVLHVTFWTNQAVDEPALTKELSVALRGKVPSRFGGLMLVCVPEENRG